MTQQQYLEQNAKGYESDTFVHDEIKNLVEKFKVNLIIETGTYLGATTKRLAELAEVMTVEVNEKHYKEASAKLNNVSNVRCMRGDSVTWLNSFLPSHRDRSILFFLDAHWEAYWPLLDELITIAHFGIKPVIVIHDFQVPGKDFGFDSYKGVPLNIDYIRPALTAIYGKMFTYHYNQQANGANRGLIYIYPAE